MYSTLYISVHIFHLNKNQFTLLLVLLISHLYCTVQYIHNSYHDTEPRERSSKKRSSTLLMCSCAKYFANMSALCEFYFAACIFAEVGSLHVSHPSSWCSLAEKNRQPGHKTLPHTPWGDTCIYIIYIVHVHMSVLDDYYNTVLENRMQPEKLISSPDQWHFKFYMC